MAARKRKKPPAKRASRSLLGARPSLRFPRPELEPHQVDVVALALIAIGIFLAGVGYLHWSGGTVGEGAITAFRFLFGALGYVVPAALVLAGALMLAREFRPQPDDPGAARSSEAGRRAGRKPGRPIRTGVVCLVASVTLALAAGTLGLGPGMLHGQQF